MDVCIFSDGCGCIISKLKRDMKKKNKDECVGDAHEHSRATQQRQNTKASQPAQHILSPSKEKERKKSIKDANKKHVVHIYIYLHSAFARCYPSFLLCSYQQFHARTHKHIYIHTRTFLLSLPPRKHRSDVIKEARLFRW